MPESVIPSAFSARHIPALDGLRGVAILMVLLFHMTIMMPVTAFDHAWVWIAGHGNSGVDVFFVLSGYLITGILLDSRESPAYFRNFYARRVLRIFPLYYLLVAFSLLILPHLPLANSGKFASVSHDAIWYWLHLSNFAIARRGKFVHGILDVSWSLAIEEQFYLLWPAVVFFVRGRWLMIVAFVLIVSAPLSRYVLYERGFSPIALYTLTFCRTDGLAMGSLIAMVVREVTLPVKRLNAQIGFVLSAVAAVGAFTAGEIHFPWQTVFASTGVCLMTAMVIYLIVTASRATALTALVDNHFLRLLGVFSYALYLFHYPLMSFVRDKVFGPAHFFRVAGSPILGQLIFYILGGGVSLLAAIASWHLFEKHFLKLKRYFPLQRIAPLHPVVSI